MRTPLKSPLTAALIAASAAALAACEEPAPVTPANPPPSASVAPVAPPPTAAAAPKLDAVPRLELNRIAAELDLPLFWIADANGNGAIDADEVATLWGVSASPPAWVKDGKFTDAFLAAYQAIAKVKAEGHAMASLSADEKARRTKVLAELAQGRPSLVRSDFRAASAEDKALVDHVLKAAEIIEQIYAKQNGVTGMAAEIPADDTMSREMFYRNQGPWCEAPLTEKDPACTALARKPAKISGLYPAALQQKDPKFCQTLQARKDQKTLLDTFSVVVEQGGDLKPVPYNVVYKSEMEAVSRELRAAADAVTSAGEAPLKAYLAAASQSFLDNNWIPADEAWAKMNVNNSKWYLRIGPDEVYFEPCSLHAGFHVSFARINQDSLAWQKKLEPVKTDMEGALAKLAGPPYKARNVSFHLPDFIDIVVNAGDSRNALGATIGQSLPNVGPVANEGRGRTVAMTNLYTDKDSEAAFWEQAKSGFCKGTMPMLSFDPAPATMSTVLHEAAHNLGPAHEYKVKGKTDKEVFGGPLSSTLEELKAQTSALYFADWLVDRSILDKKTAELAHARDIFWAFGHISQGMYQGDGTSPKPYSQLAAIQVGSFLKAGAITWSADETAPNGKDKGCFEIHMDKLPKAIADLEKVVLGIKGKGDKAGAEKLKKEFVDDDGPWKTLRGVIQERWLRAPKASFVYSVDR
jgi:hypothetical protein